MREPAVARRPTLTQEALFLIVLQTAGAGPARRSTAHQRAGVDRQIHVPLAPRNVDRVRKNVELPIDGCTADDSEPLISVSRKAGARQRGHRYTGKRPPRHRPKSQILIPGTALGGRHFSAVALQDLTKRCALGDAPIDDETLVNAIFYA